MISTAEEALLPEEIAYGTSRWVHVRRIGAVYFLEGRQVDGSWTAIGIAKDSQEPPGWVRGSGPNGDRHDALVGLCQANAGVLDSWEKDRAAQDARAKQQGPDPLGSFGGAARPGSGVAA